MSYSSGGRRLFLKGFAGTPVKLPTAARTNKPRGRPPAVKNESEDAAAENTDKRGERVRATAERFADEALCSEPLAPTQPKKIARPPRELDPKSKSNLMAPNTEKRSDSR